MKRCTHESCGVVVIRKNSAADMEAFLQRKSYRGFRGFLEIPIRTKYANDSYKRVALRELEERIRLDVNTNICERDFLCVRTEEYACVGYAHRIHIFTLLLPECMPEWRLRNSMSCEWIRSADLTSRDHHIQCNHANIVKTAFALVRKQKPEEKNIRIFQAADSGNSSVLENNPEALEESSSDCSPTAAANNCTQVVCSQSERMPEVDVTENFVSPVDASEENTWVLYRDPNSQNLWRWNPWTEEAVWVHPC